jgi:hypothetical protein
MLKALSRLYVEEVKNTHEVLKSAKRKKSLTYCLKCSGDDG